MADVARGDEVAPASANLVLSTTRWHQLSRSYPPTGGAITFHACQGGSKVPSSAARWRFPLLPGGSATWWPAGQVVANSTNQFWAPDNLLQGPRISRNPSADRHFLSDGFNLRQVLQSWAGLELFLFSGTRFLDNFTRFSKLIGSRPDMACNMALMDSCSRGLRVYYFLS